MLPQAELELLCRVSDRGRPPVPGTPLRLAIELAADSDCDPERLTEQLESDAHLSFGLLILANLPLFTRTRTVRTVRQVVSLLGNRNCLELLWVLAISDVLQTAMPRLPDRVRDRLWRHSLLTGIAALHLLESQPGVCAEAAMSGGMAHDLGHLLLANPAPRLGVVWHAEHDALPERSVEPAPEMDHCRLGGALLEFWNASPSLIAAARHHHDPLQAPAELVGYVAGIRIADLGTEALDADQSRHPVRLTSDEQWSRLQSVPPWNQDRNLDRRLIEILPESLLQAEHLANLLMKQ